MSNSNQQRGRNAKLHQPHHGHTAGDRLDVGQRGQMARRSTAAAPPYRTGGRRTA